jgi:hypothetical protein
MPLVTDPRPKPDGWLGITQPIDSEHEASAVLSELRKPWYGYGALQALLTIFLWWKGTGSLGGVADGLVCILAGYFLPRTRSRVFAAALFVYVLGCAALTIAARFGAAAGGRNVFLAAIMVLVGFRGIQATRAYHRAVGSTTVWRNVAIVTALFALATALALAGCIAAMVGLQIIRGRELSDDATGSLGLVAVSLAFGLVHLLARRRLPFTMPGNAVPQP